MREGLDRPRLIAEGSGPTKAFEIELANELTMGRFCLPFSTSRKIDKSLCEFESSFASFLLDILRESAHASGSLSEGRVRTGD
jgi:hypothetical protein